MTASKLLQTGAYLIITAARLAETEYTYLVDPKYTSETAFGTFYNNPDFRGRFDAHQLVRCHCREGELDALLSTLDRLYENTGFDFQKISGHDQATYHYLSPVLEARGWSINRTWMMILEKPSQRPANPTIEILAVDASTSHLLDQLFTVEGKLLEGYRFHRAQDPRVGGECLVARLNNQAIASTGWYVVGKIARFRRVETLPQARKLGAATSLIHYVQDHPIVKAQDALTLFCNDDGPITLYEQLGFVKRYWMWEMRLGG